MVINGGTITADSPVLNLTQTWNNAAVTFTGLKFNADGSSSTNSAGGSLLMDLQVGGSSKFRVGKDGNLVGSVASAASPHEFNTGGTGRFGFYQGSPFVFSLGYNSSPTGSLVPIFSMQGSSRFLLNAGIELCWTSGTAVVTDGDLKLNRDAADTLAQRRTTNAQTFRLYGTADGSPGSNYRRLALTSTTAGAFTLSAEGLGTGATSNSLAFATDGT
ncbi:MAG: hypothetical protein VKK05_09560, partial [Synechococcus sp.]|nr:hypothetical protein [Synechococcus sp.]